MATARTARVSWLVATCLAAGCFTDAGLPPLAGGTSTGEDEPSTSTAAADPSTGAAPTTSTGDASVGEASTGDEGPVCGDNVIAVPVEVCDDGNTLDNDACRSDCQPAECGDGVTWDGVEECDAGAGNDPKLPGACRPGCVLPKCGDGAIYVGALGPPVDVGGGPNTTSHSDDGPRAIGGAADGTFRVLWRSDGNVDALFVQPVAGDGQPTGMAFDVLAMLSWEIRDPVLAVAGDGDYLVAWEVSTNASDIRMRAVVGGVAQDVVTAHKSTGGAQDAVSVGLSDAGAAAVAFLSTSDVDVNRVLLRFFPDVAAPGNAPAETIISEHVSGLATTPTVAMLPTGGFLVAWGDPSGAIVYRRFTAGGAPGGLVTTALRLGGGAEPPGAKPWTGAALRPDGSAAIVGVDVDGHLRLQLFDAADTARGGVQVAESDAHFVPFVDVASDPVGNLAVAWVGCGSPQDAGTSCGVLPSVTAVRWFHADLSPFGPETPVTSMMSGASPVGLAVAPSGATAVTYVEGADVFVRVAPVQCP